MPSAAQILIASSFAHLPSSRFWGLNQWFLVQKITLAVTNVTSKNAINPVFKRPNAP